MESNKIQAKQILDEIVEAIEKKQSNETILDDGTMELLKKFVDEISYFDPEIFESVRMYLDRLFDRMLYLDAKISNKLIDTKRIEKMKKFVVSSFFFLKNSFERRSMMIMAKRQSRCEYCGLQIDCGKYCCPKCGRHLLKMTGLFFRDVVYMCEECGDDYALERLGLKKRLVLKR